MKRFQFLCVGLALLCGSPAFAQGAKLSSAVELAEAANGLKPGEWVWAPQLAPEGPVVVLVDLTSQLAFVYRNGINVGVSTVSTGKPGYETPTGVFTILQKDANHRSSKYNNAPMFFQERLTWDGVALHAGGLPGYPESHGCVHLPIKFAQELFKITSMGGTVVVTGRAGSPIKARAGGVLAPFEEGGIASVHTPLPDGTAWEFDASQSSEGPLSIIISTSDERVVVLRNGKEIGRARAVVPGDQSGTHAAVLHKDANGTPNWLLLGLPGHEGEANHPLDATVLERLRLPREFLRMMKEYIAEGTTIVVTSARVKPETTSRNLTLLSASADVGRR